MSLKKSPIQPRNSYTIRSKMKIFKRILLIIGLLMLIMIGVSVFGTMEDQVLGEGTVAGIREYDLKSLVAARTVKIIHHEGEFVESGEPLLEFDSRRNQDRIKVLKNEIKELDLEISVKTKALELLKKDPLPAYYRHTELELNTARERFARSEKELTVYRDLYKQRVVTRREFLQTELDYISNKMAVSRLEDDLQKVRSGMADGILSKAEEELRLLQQRRSSKEDEVAIMKAHQEDYVIRAPDAGIITDIPPRAGGYYDVGEIVVKFAANQNKKVVALIDEKQIYKVEPGQPVRIQCEQYNYLDYGYFYGTVEVVYQLPTMVNGINYYPVKILLTRERQPLRFGSRCNVTIVTGRERILALLLGIRSEDYWKRRGLALPKRKIRRKTVKEASAADSAGTSAEAPAESPVPQP